MTLFLDNFQKDPDESVKCIFRNFSFYKSRSSSSGTSAFTSGKVCKEIPGLEAFTKYLVFLCLAFQFKYKERPGLSSALSGCGILKLSSNFSLVFQSTTDAGAILASPCTCSCCMFR